MKKTTLLLTALALAVLAAASAPAEGTEETKEARKDPIANAMEACKRDVGLEVAKE